MTATRHPDHIVDLNLAAGADAKVAMDTGVEVDPHRHMAVIEKREHGSLRTWPGTGSLQTPLRFGHVPEMRGGLSCASSRSG